MFAIARNAQRCALFLCVSACASQARETPDIAIDGGAVLLDAALPTQVCDAGATRPCSCDGGSGGNERCVSDQWSACYCPPPVVIVDRAGDCEPGVYSGDFTGLAGAPVPLFPVAGLSLAGGPPLHLELTRSGSGEFTFVGSGTLRGSANGLFNFEATIEGSLDCTTKRFTGTLDGSANDVFGVLLNQVFTGTMTADYDGATKALVNGKWDLRSTDANAVDGGFSLAPTDVTGNGDWNGTLQLGDAGVASGADAGG